VARVATPAASDWSWLRAAAQALAIDALDPFQVAITWDQLDEWL